MVLHTRKNLPNMNVRTCVYIIETNRLKMTENKSKKGPVKSIIRVKFSKMCIFCKSISVNYPAFLDTRIKILRNTGRCEWRTIWFFLSFFAQIFILTDNRIQYICMRVRTYVFFVFRLKRNTWFRNTSFRDREMTNVFVDHHHFRPSYE